MSKTINLNTYYYNKENIDDILNEYYKKTEANSIFVTQKQNAQNKTLSTDANGNVITEEKNNHTHSQYLTSHQIIPTGSTSTSGIVQLSSSIDSSDESTAATSKSIKTIHDITDVKPSYISVDNNLNLCIGYDIVTSVTLSATQTQIQLNNTTTLSAIAKHENTPLEGVPIIFYENNNIIANEVTNSNGIATYVYTGTNTGEKNIKAVFNTIISEPLILTVN